MTSGTLESRLQADASAPASPTAARSRDFTARRIPAEAEVSCFRGRPLRVLAENPALPEDLPLATHRSGSLDPVVQTAFRLQGRARFERGLRRARTGAFRREEEGRRPDLPRDLRQR